MNRIRGLDSIRFVCALWVTLGHLGLPPIFGHAEHGLLHVLRGIYDGIINGPAAVIVFFVISGFCIHYPYRNGQRPHLPSYYTRRLLRIGLPLLIAIPLSGFLGAHYSVMKTGILWSLVAEIIYYLVYPALLTLHNRFGWRPVIIASFVVAYLVIATKPDSGNYPSYGDGLNWLVGLPCWLLGCLLAQRSDTLASGEEHLVPSSERRRTSGSFERALLQHPVWQLFYGGTSLFLSVSHGHLTSSP